MKDSDKTKGQLIEELAELRKRNSELEAMEIERKQTEETLRESEEQFRAIANAAIDAIVHIDNEGKIVYWPPAAEKIFGYTTHEAIGKDVHLFIAPQRYHEAYKRGFSVFKQTGEGPAVGKALEFSGVKKDGTEFPIEVSFSVINVKGSYHAVGIIRDITERKKTETELQKAAKLESLGLLAGGIAHNFNNILTAVTGNIALAKMYAKPGMEVFDIFTEVEKAASRAKNLIQQLLVFSKGGVPIKKLTSVEKLIKDSVGFALSGSNVRCDFFISDNLWKIDADEEQISHVINSLVMNAQQSMPEGGVIRISSENVTLSEGNAFLLKGGKYVKISIEDQGTGIAEEDLQRVFDPYFTTREEGSGLGLAATYSIVKQHDGHITVDSKLGVGTTFFIHLPAYDEQIKTLNDEGKATVTGEERGRVLVMDDEEMIRTVVGRMLLQCGYEAEFAKDGDEAVSLYKKAWLSGQPFDAVVIDLIIPGGTGGKEAVKRLLEVDPDVKAIVSSGYSNDPVMANYRDYGFKSFLPKPYKLDELCEILKRVIKDANK